MNNKSGSERGDHECVFGEEQEPDGRLILVPCLECGTPAIEAIKETAHLQKLCEEQEARIAHLNLVLEGYKLMAGLSTTDHLKVQKMLVSQLAEQKAENERLRQDAAHDEGTILDLRKNDYSQELTIDTLKSQLATQTERVNAQDAEIEKLRAFADHILQNYSWDNYCFEIDPADAQDKAEELGLIEKRDVNPDDYDGADWAYFTKWTPKEALNQDSPKGEQS